MVQWSGLARWWEPRLVQASCFQFPCEVLLLQLYLSRVFPSVYKPLILLMELVQSDTFSDSNLL